MGSRILLADDSITIQKVVNLTFADEGIEVVAVSNGDLAERRLNEVKPDLVLADIFMPGKNGYELCEAIKQNPQFRGVPVVLLVGAFEPFDQAEARRVRADAHLTKPFESRTLVETVRRLINATGRTTGPIAQMPSPGDEREENFQADAMPPRLTTPAVSKLDLSEMMVDHTPPTPSAVKNTGELASSLAGAQSDVAVMEMPVQESVNARLTDVSEQFDLLEMPPIGEFTDFDTQSPSRHSEPDMILDFDRPEPPPVQFAPLSSLSFDAEPMAPLDVDVSAASNGAGLFSPTSLDSLEIPSTDEAWHASTTTSGPSGDAPDIGLGLPDESAFAPSESSSESASTTMLAGEDPLGDVLFDETVSAGMIHLPQDSLDIELTEPAVIDGSATGATQFDLVETGDDSPWASEAIEVKAEEVDFSANEEKMAVQERDESAEGYAADSRSPGAEVVGTLDWTTPSARNYSTAQLDSVMMPIDTAAYLRENPSDNGAAQSDITEEASFERAQMWPEEEAHFTAIDIESFPVEEAERLSPSQDQLGAQETGFAFSSVTQQATTAAEAPAANAAASEPSTNGAPSGAELPSATIDEIVRRVVAEMSESVVREVAWEVVPDCVERVIDQLTRESLSKRA